MLEVTNEMPNEMLELPGDIKSARIFVRDYSDALNLYASVLVTYGGAVFFLICSVMLNADKGGFIFWGIGLLLFGISYVIRRDEAEGDINPVMLFVLLGNAFGFLFSGIYAIVKISMSYSDFLPNFGGIEKFVLHGGPDGISVIEGAYIAVGAILFFQSMMLIMMYWLSWKDTLEKEGRKFMAALSFLGAIASGFLFPGFLGLLYNFVPNVATYLFYSIAGSMLFIYAANLFTKRSGFLLRIPVSQKNLPEE